MKGKVEPHDLLVAFLLVESQLERRSEAFFQKFGITSAQFNILNLLASQKGKIDQMTLADLLLVGKSSISIVLNRMVRDKWVTRKTHSRDRRQVVLHLTAPGMKLWKKVSVQYEAAVKRVFGALPSSRRRQFLADLQILHASFLSQEGKSKKEATKQWQSHFNLPT